MMPIEKLEEIIADQLKMFKGKDLGVLRDIDFAKYIKTRQITVISGIRRSGKSTLLVQFSKKFGHFYYVNFDDERLIDFQVKDFNNLMLIFHKTYEAKVIFIDEVQNINRWELFVRRLYEEGYKIFVNDSICSIASKAPRETLGLLAKMFLKVVEAPLTV